MLSKIVQKYGVGMRSVFDYSNAKWVLLLSKDNLRKVVLVTTEDCNMSCRYCYETHKTNSYMTFETAKIIIDSELNRLPTNSEIDIEMIGGEPFMPKAFECFKRVIEYIDEKYNHRNISFVITTNGTLVHGEVQDFIKKYSHKIKLSLSLDGTKKSNDINRLMKNGKSCFESIDLKFFQEYPIPVNAKMTVSPLTLKYLAEDIKYISEELGFIPTATLASGIPWEKDFIATELVEQLGELVDYYSQNDKELPLLLATEFEGVFAEPNPNCKPCGAGEITRAFCHDCIDDDGTIEWYPCQGLAPITLGCDEAEQFKNSTFLDFHLKEPCASCKFRMLCHSCQATNFGVTGDVEKPSETMCLLNRLCALAASKIEYNRMKKRGFSDLSSQEQITLKAIQIIQSEIFDDNKHQFLYKTTV